MKAHKEDMYAAWARDHGIEGFEQWDPKNREKARQRGVKLFNKRNENRDYGQTRKKG
tara:strand:+ start:305 stop:475 length:171 start_codon:yes stop_codon:yes gene_type:complete